MEIIRRQRFAIAAIFFVNGLCFANMMSRIPEIQSLYGMSNAILGATLFCRAAGALLAMPFVGRLSAQFNSAQMTRFVGIGMACMLPILVSMPSVWLFAFIFFLLGVSEGILDVNMNEQAVFIERAYGRPIMSSFHAVFSAGMSLGAFCGGVMSYYQVPLPAHFAAIALCSLGIISVASPYFIQISHTVADTDDKPLFLLPSKAILPLGIIAFCCMTGEGTMADWSAVYMTQILSQSNSMAAAALAAFNIAMFGGRVIGDTLNHRLGSRKLLLADSTAALLGLGLVLLAPNAWLALAGFFIIGLGLSTIVPIVYSAAGNTPGIAPSVGIAMATSVGYAGFFVGPPAIGYLSELHDLRVGMLFTLCLFVIMWALIWRRR